MLLLNSEQIPALAPMSRLIECLQHAFCAEYVIPAWQVTTIPGGAGERLFPSLPAFDYSAGGAVKLATFFSDDRDKGLPPIQAAIAVFSPTGAPPVSGAAAAGERLNEVDFAGNLSRRGRHVNDGSTTALSTSDDRAGCTCSNRRPAVSIGVVLRSSLRPLEPRKARRTGREAVP